MPVTNTIEKKVKRGLSGLAVCGGKSSRMGTDKSLLCYHKMPQRDVVFQMLGNFCESSFISCNEEQGVDFVNNASILVDLRQFKDIGPMAALLTAFERYPNNDLLIVGCDYPFLTEDELANFIASCMEDHPAAFYNKEENLYEPLLGYYPASVFPQLKIMAEQKQYSLQHFLRANDAIKYFPADIKTIWSIDHYNDQLQAVSILQKQSI